MKKIRRQMKVARAENIVQIKILEAHLGHDAGIGKNVALFRTWQNHRKASLSAGEVANAREVSAALRETSQTKITQRITSNGGAETDTVAQQREIVSEDRRGTAESKA